MIAFLVVLLALVVVAAVVAVLTSPPPKPPAPPSALTPAPTADLASAVLSERDRRRRDREAAEIRSKLDSLIAGEFAAPAPEAPRPNP